MSGTDKVDLKKLIDRLSLAERVVGAASVLLLVSLFLNWLSFSCSGAFCGSAGAGATGFHGWGWLSFLALMGVAGLLVIRRFLSGAVTLPELPAADAVLYMAGGALEILGCLLFWVEYHDSFSSSGSGLISFSYGLGIGWYFALVFGIATVVGGYLAMRDPQAAPARPYSPPAASAPPPVA